MSKQFKLELKVSFPLSWVRKLKVMTYIKRGPEDITALTTITCACSTVRPWLIILNQVECLDKLIYHTTLKFEIVWSELNWFEKGFLEKIV